MNKVSQPRFTKRTKLSYGFLSVTLWRKPQRVITANTRIYDRMSDLVKFDSLGNPTTPDHREDIAKRIKTIRDAVELYRDEVEVIGREYSSAELQRVVDNARDYELAFQRLEDIERKKYSMKSDEEIPREIQKIVDIVRGTDYERAVDKALKGLENEEEHQEVCKKRRSKSFKETLCEMKEKYHRAFAESGNEEVHRAIDEVYEFFKNNE
jgi:hypothetical protein